jgi:signal transduction histidine kinase
MFSMKRVGLKLEAAADVVVYGSSQELKQVLKNLQINAQESVSRESGRRATVTDRIDPESPSNANPRADTFTLLEVEDDGGGIPPEMLETLFDKFTTSKPSGSGLGLYLSRMIVERHFDGSISARNEGGGAVFTVRLPGRLSATPSQP